MVYVDNVSNYVIEVKSEVDHYIQNNLIDNATGGDWVDLCTGDKYMAVAASVGLTIYLRMMHMGYKRLSEFRVIMSVDQNALIKPMDHIFYIHWLEYYTIELKNYTKYQWSDFSWS